MKRNNIIVILVAALFLVSCSGNLFTPETGSREVKKTTTLHYAPGVTSGDFTVEMETGTGKTYGHL